MRKVAELAFGDAGMDVSTAIDGQAAMETFVREQPDVVLADIGLAGTSGYQICEMIKQDEATSHIPVLLMVGAFEPFDQTEAERVGADGFLMKPFNSIRDVITQIRELLDDGSNSETESFNIATEIADEVDDIESLYVSSFVETTRVEEVFIGDMLPPDDAEPDDELIERATPEIQGLSPFEWTVDDEVSAVSAPDDDEDMDFLETIEISEVPHSHEVLDQGLEVAAEDEIAAEPVEHNEPFDKPVIDEAPQASTPEISDELIDRIADRVIAKMSDSIVREIAQDSVPRVAERLMREALEQDVKD
jgi:CheY-like chemotaxis protein